MTWAFAIVLIALIMVGGAVLRARYNAMNGYGTDDQGNPIGSPRRERELEEEIEQLRERLAVLERIATDDRESKQLAQEIERLRDERDA